MTFRAHTGAALLRRGVAAVAIAAAAAAPAYSAEHWLSGVTIIQDGQSTRLSPEAFTAGAASAALSQSGTAVFDLTISLEENPQGDDEYPENDLGGVNDDAQNAFEERLEEFADAVFQMTNGAHKIGKITVFRDSEQATIADVFWEENCARDNGPWANPSGYGKAGMRIHMCTNWAGSSSMATPKGSGFTFAHEWGHYVYGLYDEYSAAQCTNFLGLFCGGTPKASDTESEPSIMNNQWRAVRGDADYLEFSTEDVAPFNSIFGSNAQKRQFGESGWDTLTRDPATDPKFKSIPPRTQYTTLDPVKPSAPNWLVNDNESDARSELDIVWAGDQVVELMIDTSGSMGGGELDTAKIAANLLIGQLNEGETAIGVGEFDSSATQPYAITDIPDPDTGVKAAAQAAVNGLSSGGGTNIEGASIFALNQTQGFQGGSRPSVVYLLTDGRSSVDVNNVVTQYQAASVPMITFGFGSNTDVALLTALANGTSGAFFQSPTTLAEIQQAFIAANAAFSSNVFVASGSQGVAASATDSVPLILDSTLDSASVTLSYPGPESDVSLTLLLPDGTDSGLTFDCSGTGEVSCSTTVDVAALGAGTYTAEVTNASGAEKEVSALVSGSPSVAQPFEIDTSFTDVTYPESFVIESVVRKGPALTGLEVVADVTDPASNTFEVKLLDDGVGADAIADDGVYSAAVNYDQDGVYSAVVRASNPNGTAQTTFNGVSVSLREDGSAVIPTPQSVPENFARASTSSASVSGTAADDHPNDPTVGVGGGCTVVADDNTDTPGRIDAAGDVDCFEVTVTDPTSSIVGRVTGLQSGMDPVVRVYDSTGTTELATVTLADSENESVGLIATISADDLEAGGNVVTVEHADGTAASGNYDVSVGPQLVSDVEETPEDPADDGSDDDDSGGAFGPWSLIVIAFLALVGLRQRRVRS